MTTSPTKRFAAPWLFAAAMLLIAVASELPAAPADERLAIVVDAALPAPAELALADLEAALAARKIATARQRALSPDDRQALVVGLAGASSLVDQLLTSHGVELPAAAESLCIRRLEVLQQPVLLLAGRDGRGLSYALSEAAQAVRLAPPEISPLAAVREAAESPALAVRNVSIHPFSADLEADWYYSPAHWREYFAMLAANRFNHFTLTFADQTNYLNPVYAYLVDVPDYPEVKADGVTAEVRRRNLAMLAQIAQLAQERGLTFNLGIWMQAPVPRYSGKVEVHHLPEGLAAADYCGQALEKVLRACPAIDGVQFRVNDEAGVSAEEQTEFYRPLIRAVRDCGRPIRLDLRYKGLQPETTQAALDAGLDVTVSTKFWCEHLGLPYHPTTADSHYRRDRYSFGSMLEKPRAYRVVYQLWTVGCQRVLLWGDPLYAARFAESCRLGGGEGFEVFAPLTNKGYGNAPGNWPILDDPDYRLGRWEWERYWLFYQLFGRLGYNPRADADIWQREFRHRFGPAAAEIEAAYRAASQVLPLVTAAHLPGASEWSWWPEMDTGGNLAEYLRTPPSDTGRFYAIRTFARTPRWRWEDWDDDIPGFVEDAVAGRLRGKTTPPQVSQLLLQLADETERNLAQAAKKTSQPAGAEFRSTSLDLAVLAQLARYHGEKTCSAVQLAFFEATGEAGRLPPALTHAQAARDAWRKIAELTTGIYHHNLVFGVTPDSPRSRMGHHHSGHWQDRLSEVQQDVDDLENLIAQHGGEGKPVRTFAGEEPATFSLDVRHTPPTVATAGKDLNIEANIKSSAPIKAVILHYRPLNQTLVWQERPMSLDGAGDAAGKIPGERISAQWDMQYFLEVLVDGGGGRLWPDWQTGQAYFVARVQRSEDSP